MSHLKPVYILLISILLFSCSQKEHTTLSKTKKDSIEKFLATAFNERLPHKERYDSNIKALSIISKLPNDTVKRFYYLKVAGRFWNMNNLKDYKTTTNALINLSQTSKDSSRLAKGYQYLSDMYNFKTDSSYYYKSLSEKIYIKIKDTLGLAEISDIKGNLLTNEFDYRNAEKTFFNAIKLLEAKKHKQQKHYKTLYSLYTDLGAVYGLIEEFDTALIYYDKALVLENKFPQGIDHTHELILNNIGAAFNGLKKPQKALKYLMTGFENPDLPYENPYLYAIILMNIEDTKLKLKKDVHSPLIFLKAYRITDSLHQYDISARALLGVSEIYERKHDTILSIAYAKKALTIAEKNKAFVPTLSCLRKLSLIDYKNIEQYLPKYLKMSDSMEVVERRAPNRFARIEFETDNLIQQQKQLKAENAQKDRKITTVASLFGIAFLLTIITYLLNRQRVKSKELKLVKQQHEANEEIYKLMLTQQQQLDEGRQQEKKRIAKELHDGVMGRLTSIRLNLFVLGRKQDPDTIQKALGHIDEIREVEKEIRSIAYDLGTNAFDAQSDFLAIVRNIFTAMENHSGTRFTLQADEAIDWQAIDGHTKMQLYRILQEALQNIVKYAQANEVTVRIRKEAALLVITVTDNGIGFDKKQADKGFGLGNMKERAHELGGKLKVQSEVGKGTSIIIAIPMSHE